VHCHSISLAPCLCLCSISGKRAIAWINFVYSSTAVNCTVGAGCLDSTREVRVWMLDIHALVPSDLEEKDYEVAAIDRRRRGSMRPLNMDKCSVLNLVTV
jgi:hypothetical protein